MKYPAVHEWVGPGENLIYTQCLVFSRQGNQKSTSLLQYNNDGCQAGQLIW